MYYFCCLLLYKCYTFYISAFLIKVLSCPNYLWLLSWFPIFWFVFYLVPCFAHVKSGAGSRVPACCELQRACGSVVISENTMESPLVHLAGAEYPSRMDFWWRGILHEWCVVCSGVYVSERFLHCYHSGDMQWRPCCARIPRYHTMGRFQKCLMMQDCTPCIRFSILLFLINCLNLVFYDVWMF